jgi:hypothetical protein
MEKKAQSLAGPPLLSNGMPAGPATTPPEPITSLPSGIWDNPSPPFGGSFIAANAWSGKADGDWWWVFAGEVAADMPGAGDGGVVLMEEPDTDPVTGPTRQSGPYLPPAAVVGALTVMSVSGDVLTLSDGGGETFTFDLASSSYT